MEDTQVQDIERQVVDAIRRAIENSGKSAEKIAFEAGISKATLSQLLAQNHSPRLSTLIRLSYGLDRPIVIDANGQ